jgi:YegS/Rv2252/BmrU family lipid kinase
MELFRRRPLNNISGFSRRLIGAVRRRVDRSRRIVLIVNPASGQDRPILKTINTVMQATGVKWDLVLTKKPGDAYRLAQKAVAAGADTVGVYGGDGTAAEVASGLSGTGVELGLLPGGTANMLATSLGIPRDFTQALHLITGAEHIIRHLPLGRANRYPFFQLVGVGMNARIVQDAGREAKNRLGFLAYGVAALSALVNGPIAHYHLELDEEIIDMDGVTCLVINADNLLPGISIPAITAEPPIPRCGLLDVVLIHNAGLPSVVSLAATVAGASINVDLMPHWQARKVTIQSDPPQPVQSDGEMVGETPLNARVLKQMIPVIVPQQPNLLITEEEEEAGEETDLSEKDLEGDLESDI